MHFTISRLYVPRQQLLWQPVHGILHWRIQDRTFVAGLLWCDLDIRMCFFEFVQSGVTRSMHIEAEVC